MTYNPIKDGFTVAPGKDGSFVVHTVEPPVEGERAQFWGFSSLADMLRWLEKQAHPLQWQQETSKAVQKQPGSPDFQGYKDDKKPAALPAPASPMRSKGSRFRFGPFFSGHDQ